MVLRCTRCTPCTRFNSSHRFHPQKPDTSLRASNCAASARLTTRPGEKYMCMVYGIEFHAARRRRIASPRTCGAPRGCNHSETVMPLVIHGEMTRCAPRRDQRTRFRRCGARNGLKGPSSITRRRHSSSIAMLVDASRLGRVSLLAFWGSLSSPSSAPTARVHNVAFSSFIERGV